MSDDEKVPDIDEAQVVKEIEEPDVPQEDYYPPVEILIDRVRQIIKQGLTKIGKTSDAQTYAYVELKCENKQLTDLYNIMDSYQHLRKISFVNNKLQDSVKFQSIPFLTHLDLSKNNIVSLSSFNDKKSLQFLQELNLTNNKITQLQEIALPALRSLILNGNIITSCEKFTGHPQLQVLKLKQNKLKSTQGIQNMPGLIKLTLSENELSDFSSLSNLPYLKKLNLRKNQIVTLQDVPDLPLLHKLSLKENQIQKMDEFRALLKFKSLRLINTIQTPISEEIGDSIKKEIIMILQDIVSINKEEVTQDERTDALNELKERLAEIERRRKEEEEEQIRLAEEARQLEEQKKLEQTQDDNN